MPSSGREGGGQSSGEEIVELAWRALPRAHRQLLESIGASQFCVIASPLGNAIDELRRSGGLRGLTVAQRHAHNEALAIWDRQLRLVVINEAHPKLIDLDEPTREQFLSRLAWHEWAHALSIERCSRDDVASGEKLMSLAPPGVRDGIRAAGYRRSEYTHELVADIYAMLIARRLRGQEGRPEWLNDLIYDLIARVTGWTE